MATALCFSVAVSAQDTTAIRFGKSIKAEDLYKHLSILASDSLEGRETGEAGQKMAADYIKEQFKGDDLMPVVDGEKYYQSFELEESAWKDVYLKYNDTKKKNLKDILYLGDKAVNKEETVEIIFAGELKESDFKGLDIEGKAVALFADDIRGLRSKLAPVEDKGIKAFFIVYNKSKEEIQKTFETYSHYLSEPSLGLPSEKVGGSAVFVISPAMAAEIFDTSVEKLRTTIEKNKESDKNKLKKIKPAEVSYKAERKTEKIITENVLGFIEGTEEKDEAIVITAHYDHVGINDGKIYNGADDDGSGTSAVLELAEAFALAKEAGYAPKRSLLFMTVTGEEKGLLGSKYYVNHPVFPLEKTVANLNIDMIGRIDKAHEGNGDYIYLIGTDRLSTELHDLSEEVNSNYVNLDLDYTYNDENDPNRYYYRSDHYNFAKNNIPVIFYFNGVHEDYHQPTDTVEKINFEKMEKISRLIFYTAWELANREERIKLDEVEGEN